MTEMVLVIAIVAILSVVAFPRLISMSNNLPALTAADQLVAALQHAHMLAQRQGVATSVVIANSAPNVKVVKNGTSVYLPTIDTNYPKLYQIDFDSSVTISPTGTVSYGVDGIPASAPTTFPITFTLLKGDLSYTVTLTSLGYAYGN